MITFDKTYKIHSSEEFPKEAAKHKTWKQKHKKVPWFVSFSVEYCSWHWKANLQGFLQNFEWLGSRHLNVKEEKQNEKDTKEHQSWG